MKRRLYHNPRVLSRTVQLSVGVSVTSLVFVWRLDASLSPPPRKGCEKMWPEWTCLAISLTELVRVVQSSHHAPACQDARVGRIMMMDQLLASLFTREREDYIGRFFHSIGDELAVASRIRIEHTGCDHRPTETSSCGGKHKPAARATGSSGIRSLVSLARATG